MPQNLISAEPLVSGAETSGQPTGAALKTLDVMGVRVSVYRQSDVDENVVILPVFAFEQDTKVIVKSKPDNSQPNNTILTITLDVYPTSIRSLVAQRLKEAAVRIVDPTVKALFSGLDEGKVNIVPLRLLAIDDVTPGEKIKFNSISLSNVAGNQVKLDISVPSLEAAAVTTGIEAGNRRFAIHYAIWAKTEDARATATVDFRAIQRTAAFRNIEGDVTSSDWQPKSVTRQQKLELQRLSNLELSTSFDIEDPADLDRLQSLVKDYLSSAFLQKTLTIDNEEGWNRLALYGFSQADTNPAKIRDFIRKAHDDIKDHGSTEVGTSLKAEGRYLGIGGSLEGSFDGKWLKEHDSEHDLSLEIHGDIGIPVGLKIHATDQATLENAGHAVNQIVRSHRNVLQQTLPSVTTESISFPVNQMATFEQRISVLESDAQAMIGSVVAYAGQMPPPAESGWMICDGSPLPRTGHEKLMEAIGTAYGEGNDAQGRKVGDFNLPDYRGLFLRSVDPSGRIDEEMTERKPNKSGLTGAPGSTQDDGIKAHLHPLAYHHNDGSPAKNQTVTFSESKYGGIPLDAKGGSDQTGDNTPGIADSQPDAHKETRPKNIYVFYLIRVR